MLTLKLNNCIRMFYHIQICVYHYCINGLVLYSIFSTYDVYGMFSCYFLLQLRRKRDLIRLQRNIFVSRKVSIWLCEYMYECMYICNYLLFCLLITSVLICCPYHIAQSFGY